jgi:hypothetical protein
VDGDALAVEFPDERVHVRRRMGSSRTRVRPGGHFRVAHSVPGKSTRAAGRGEFR